MPDITIGVIGGGSLFTPELVELLALNAAVTGSVEVRLMDIDKNRQQIVGNFCERIAKRTERPLTVKYADSYKDAIENSDYIFIQFRVGGEESRVSDDRLGMKYRIPFVETVTVCGLGSFMRTYYQMEIIADLVTRYAPDAWVMNFANPSGVLTEVLHKLGCKKVIGVCNGSVGMINDLATKLNVNYEDIFINWRGLNHLTVVDRILCKGVNVYDKIVDQMTDDDDGDGDIQFPKRLIQNLGFIPNSYMRYNYLKEKMVEKLQKEEKTRAEAVREVNAGLLELYKNKALDTLPDELKRRGGFGYSRAVANLIKGMIVNDRSIHYAQVQNGSIFRELPPDAFIEVPVLAMKDELRPIQVEELPEAALPLIITMKKYEQLLIEAAKAHSANGFYKAMIVNPLFGSDCIIAPLLDDLLEANKEYMPDIS